MVSICSQEITIISVKGSKEIMVHAYRLRKRTCYHSFSMKFLLNLNSSFLKVSLFDLQVLSPPIDWKRQDLCVQL